MISILSMERIAKKAGVHRVSKQALEELREAVMDYGSGLAEQAVLLSRHAGRKTVMQDDVLFVAGRSK